MKLYLLVALCSMAVAAPAMAAEHLNTQLQEKAFTKIASLDQLNGYDVSDTRKFVATATPKQVHDYIVKLSYEKAKTIDNPNAMDLEDLHASLDKKSLTQLVE